MVSTQKLSHCCFTIFITTLLTSHSATFSRNLQSLTFCLILFWHKMCTFTRARLKKWNNSFPTTSQTFFLENNMTVSDLTCQNHSCICCLSTHDAGASTMLSLHAAFSHTHGKQMVSLYRFSPPSSFCANVLAFLFSQPLQSQLLLIFYDQKITENYRACEPCVHAYCKTPFPFFYWLTDYVHNDE
jgi:hypothetical protein